MNASELIKQLRMLEPWCEIVTETGQPLMLTFCKDGMMIGPTCEHCEEMPCMCAWWQAIEMDANP